VPSEPTAISMPAPAGRARAARWQRSRLAAHRAAPPDAAPLLDDRRLGGVRARLDELCARGRLDRVPSDPHTVADGVHLAAMNFRRAVRHIEDPDVAVVFLYQSVVNTADTMLHCLGHHARDFEGHKLAIAVTTELVAALQGSSRARLMSTTSDRLRRRRHEALYSRPGVMTETDVRVTLEECRDFLPRLWTLAGRLAGAPAAAAEAAAVA
jgi:hypothetical protein